MANQLIGRVKKITPPVTIPTKSGTPFVKRELVLDCTRCDSFTGEPGRTNILCVTFTQGNCELLNQFSPGDLITVDFVAEGYEYTAQTGEVRYLTSLRGYRAALFRPGQPSREPQTFTAQTPAPQPAPQPIQPAPQPYQPQRAQQPAAGDDLPF